MERKSTVIFLQPKKKDSEYSKIKSTNTRKEERILIQKISLNYPKKELWYPHNNNLMDHTWRKQFIISTLKSYRGKNKSLVPIKKKLKAASI